ncbi:MAG: 2-oxoacid:acceptor oxidoreductase subunit alpha, partial [Acetobacteraceae bacterium]|nr:2-oxoacid:acceptor oxidoreductase subunit alpha [Acetobacteraceae bacterium]
ALLCLWAALRFVEDTHPTQGLMIYTAAAASGMYTLYYFAFWLVGVNLTILWLLWQQKSEQRWRRIGIWLSAQVGIFFLFLPWLPIFVRQTLDPPVPPWRTPWTSFSAFFDSLAETLAARLPAVGGTYVQMEDEIASMAAVIGASIGGLKAMTATSGPGFSLKQENLGYAAVAEVPCVVVNVQRAGPSTGVPTAPAQGDVMQARWGTHGDHPAVALCPWSVAETFEQTVRAFNLAEELRTPVILLMDEVVAHMRERVTVPEPGEIPVVDRPRPSCGREEYLPFSPPAGSDVPPMARFGDGYRYHITGLAHDPAGRPTTSPPEVERMVRRLVGKVESRRERLARVEGLALDDAEVAVVAYGGTARSAARAVRLARERGRRAGLFRPVTIWPFPESQVQELAGKVRALVVAEMNLGQMVLEVERCVRGRVPVRHVGRPDGDLLPPEDILAAIEGV